MRLRASAIVVAVVVLGLLSAYGVYAGTLGDRVYRGVSVLGKDLSGMTRDEARAAVSQAAQGYPADRITLTDGNRTWTFGAADLGVGVDVDRTVDTALSVGRSGGAFDNAFTQVGTLFGGKTVTPALKYDEALLDKAVASVAGELDKPAVDSALGQDQDGKVVLSPSSYGTVVDRPAVRQAIARTVVRLPYAPVQVVMRDDAPRVTEEALKAAESQALLVTEQPVVLTSGKHTWTIDPAELRHMLSLAPTGDSGLRAKLDNNSLAAYLAPIADKLRAEPVDAGIVLKSSSVALREDEAGAELDVPSAIAAVQQAAQQADANSRAVELPVKTVEASVKTAQVKPLYDKVNGLVTQGIRFHTTDDGYTIRGGAVVPFIDVQASKGGPGPLKLVVDADGLAAAISDISYYLNRPASDARFRMVNGTPKRVASAQDGLKVDVDGSVQNALKAIDAYQGGDKLQVSLQVAITEAKVKDADVSGIQTPDLLGHGETYYVGSSAERAWNVEFGASKIDGALVPPGGVFSTVDTIGPLTLDAGFKMGYMIVSDGGDLKTVPAEAGGICQVATTLFHSVWWSGLEVVERHWHSYWISSYGVKPSGLQGLDATIAPPDYDFRFRNNTGHWIMIRATSGKGKLAFDIYGINPGWKVSVSGPVITNRVATDTSPITEYSDKLPKGKTVLVEHAQDGFSASITRTVTDAAGNVVDKWNARSTYAPAHNRTLIGTGPARP